MDNEYRYFSYILIKAMCMGIMIFTVHILIILICVFMWIFFFKSNNQSKVINMKNINN